MSRKTTVGHHLIGRSLKDKYRIDDPRNIAVMEQVRERGLHALFQELLEPHTQLEYLNGLFRPIQSKLIRELCDELNKVPRLEWYDDGLAKKDPR